MSNAPRVYANLASLRTSACILLAMALLLALGAISSPGVVKPFSYPLFLALASALFINLALSAYNGIFSVLHGKKHPEECTRPRTMLLTQDGAEARAEVARILREELGFRVKKEDNGWMVMEKGLPRGLAAWLYRGGAAICLAGVALTLFLAYEGVLNLPPGEPRSIALFSLPGVEHGASSFRLVSGGLVTEYTEGPGRERPGYKTKAGTLFPVRWKLKLAVEDEGATVRETTLEIGDTQRYGGYTFNLLDFDQTFRLRVGDNPIILETTNSEEIIVPGLDLPVSFSMFRTGTIRKLDGTVTEITPHTRVKYSADAGDGYDEDLGRIEPGGSVYINGTRLTLVDVVETPVLRYRYDPGARLLWLGGGIALLAITLRAFVPWHMAAYRVDASKEIVRLDAHFASKGVFSDPGTLAVRLERQLTVNDIKPTPLEDGLP